MVSVPFGALVSHSAWADFGLRNIMSVLRAVGFEKRKYMNDSEQLILLRVLRNMNVSKLVRSHRASRQTLWS